MPKDASKNINRYKIRGGQLNPFEYQQNQAAVSQQGSDHEGYWPANHQIEDGGLPADQAEAARHKQLLTAHGESVPKQVEATQDFQAAAAAQPASLKKTAAQKSAKTKASPKSAPKSVTMRDHKATAKARAK